MTREEEIVNAAMNCKDLGETKYHSFAKGAVWADEHPKNPWVSVEERLPIKECDYDGNRKFVFVKVRYFDTNSEWIERAAS